MAIKPNKLEEKVLDLIRQAKEHQASCMGQEDVTEMAASAADSGLNWLEFVVKQGILREKE